MNKTAIILCNYNMFEYADALVEHIYETVKRPYDLIVVDNGSDLVPPSQYTTHHIPENIQMTPGFMWGLDQLEEEYFAYWLITTSVRFEKDDFRDPLDALLKVLEDGDLVYAVQPSFHFTWGAWVDLLSPRQPPKPRRVWGLEYAATLFRAKYFDELGRWNKRLIRGWGIASESAYLARKSGYRLYTHDGYVMYKDSWIGYELGRMNETGKERAAIATEECKKVLGEKYGEDYLEVLNWSYRETGRGEY